MASSSKLQLRGPRLVCMPLRWGLDLTVVAIWGSFSQNSSCGTLPGGRLSHTKHISTSQHWTGGLAGLNGMLRKCPQAASLPWQPGFLA